jgi:flagellar motor switch protein FliM
MENVEPSTNTMIPPAMEAVGSAGVEVGGAVTVAEQQVKSFDFRQPSLLTGGQLRKLEFRHEAFIRSLTTRLSIYFRTEFNLRISDFQTQLYPRLIQSLPAETQMTLFKVDGLAGHGLLQMSPAFGISLVERLLGGSGVPLAENRPLTELEANLLEHAVQLILKEWELNVVELAEAKVEIFGHETNPRFLRIAAEDAAMLVLSLEVRAGETTEVIRIACPYTMLENAFRELDPVVMPVKKAPLTAPEQPPQWNARLDEVKVKLSAAWSGIQVKAETLARLQSGDVLPLQSELFGQVQVRLATITKFTGRLGQCNDCWAVELSAPVKNQI